MFFKNCKLLFVCSLSIISGILDIKTVHCLLLLHHLILLFICATLHYKCIKIARIIEQNHEPEIRQYLFSLPSDCLRYFLDKRFVSDKLNSLIYFTSWTVGNNKTIVKKKEVGMEWNFLRRYIFLVQLQQDHSYPCGTWKTSCLGIFPFWSKTWPLQLNPLPKWVLGGYFVDLIYFVEDKNL